jgi:RHS repeat-associated protein
VWFDDLKVTHTQNIVVQATDYGVWGDVLRVQKTDESIYRYAYQGQFAEKDEETGWNHFELREYDPMIGRWLIPDPFREFWTPYVAFGNNPVNVVDPRGGETDCPSCDAADAQWGALADKNAARATFWDDVVDFWNGLDFVLEGSANVDIGIRAKIHGSYAGLSGNVDVNVVNVNLLQGKGDFSDPLNPDSWSGSYVGKNGDKTVSNGISANVNVPLLGKNKLGVGFYAEQSQRVHNGYSEDYESSAGINLLVPIVQKNNKSDFPGRRPEFAGKAGKKKDFYGLDVGAGAQFILGADVNLKIGFSR